MVSSLLHLGPPIPDTLPLYTRDPETSSIRSAAPSYKSAAPSYHSTRPQPPRRSTTTTLPSSHYAPGFRAPTTANVNDLEKHRFEISEWSAVSTGHHARQYQNVALRRATISQENARAAALLGLPATALPPVAESPLRPGTPLPDAIPADEPYRFVGEPGAGGRGEFFSAHEDPHLVGDAAAAEARAQRLFLRRCGDDEALRQERKMWDFMLGQMGDWRERERSWEQFRREVGRSRALGRRLGLGRGGK